MKHKVEFLIPGTLMPESTVRELTSRDPEEALSCAPDHAFAFTIYDVEDAPDLGPDFKVTAKRKNVSGRYYIDAEPFEIAEVRAMGEDILAANMQANRWDTVVRCRTGNWQPFTDEDHLVRSLSR